MKNWTVWALPIALFLLIFGLLVFLPGVGSLPQSPSFRNMPYVLLLIAILLGIAFSQSRVAIIGLLLLSVVFATNRSFSGGPQVRGPAVVLLAVIYIPMLTVIFRHVREPGIFTPKGLGSVVLVLSSAVMIMVLPEIDFFRRGILESEMSMLNPRPGPLRIPGIGILTFCSAIPLLLIRREHENQRIGPAFAFMLLFMLAGLNYRSSLWTGHEGRAVFLAFTSGAALLLVWYVLENSWFDAYVDELTELLGRRSMKQHLARLYERYSIAILDIDRFKDINDKYGHNTGDQVLRFIAAHLKDSQVGKPYRYGGEEFVIVFERSSFEEATAELEELRRRIADRKFVLRSKHRPRRKPAHSPRHASGQPSESIGITVSIGVAQWSEKLSTAHDVLVAADKALYRAKDEGRNCLRTSD